MSAAHVEKRLDEVDVEAVAGLQRPGHVDVVVRIGVGGVRMQPEHDGPDEPGRSAKRPMSIRTARQRSIARVPLPTVRMTYRCVYWLPTRVAGREGRAASRRGRDGAARRCGPKAMPVHSRSWFRASASFCPRTTRKARLGPALDELFAYLCGRLQGTLPELVSVLVVDDGSTDGTAALVRARPEFVGSDVPPARRDCPAPGLLTVSHGGKGSAVRAGMLAADGDLLVFADADMATPPDQLSKLAAALETADLALGSRIQPDGSDMRRDAAALSQRWSAGSSGSRPRPG